MDLVTSTPTTKAPAALFTGDVARVGTRDGRVLEVRPGQTVWCPPDEEHWHGAGPDAFMEHLAMWEATEARDGSETTWAEGVTDEQYGGRS